MKFDKALCIQWEDHDFPDGAELTEFIQVGSKEEAKKVLPEHWDDNPNGKVLYAWYQDETEGKSYSLYSIDAGHNEE